MYILVFEECYGGYLDCDVLLLGDLDVGHFVLSLVF